jgi:hypothetical protein
MRPRKPDPSFLYMAAVAAAGGLLAICVSIGYPLWQAAHGQPYRPAFMLFAGWGVASLSGAYACWRTYLLTDSPPPRPPGGGVRLEFRRVAEPVAAKPPAEFSDRRAA